jgi:hypothetical protein
MTERDLFVKSLSPIQRKDYSLALEKYDSIDPKKAEDLARADMLQRFPVIQQQMEKLREPPKPKVKKEKPDKNAVDFIRDIHWVYETMGLGGPALKEAKDNAPSGGALGMLERAKKSETFADRILSQVRQLEANKAKLEEGAKKRVNTRIILDLIDRCIQQAWTDAGAVETAHVESPEGHDPAVVVSQEPDPPG